MNRDPDIDRLWDYSYHVSLPDDDLEETIMRIASIIEPMPTSMPVDERSRTWQHLIRGTTRPASTARRPNIAVPPMWAVLSLVIVGAMIVSLTAEVFRSRSITPESQQPIAEAPRGISTGGSPSPVAQGCDYTTWPLILQANAAPFDVYTVYLNDAGEVRIHCPGEMDRTIAEGVVLPLSTGAPQTLELYLGDRNAIQDQPATARLQYLHIPTGKTLSVSSDALIPPLSGTAPWSVRWSAEGDRPLSLFDLHTLDAVPIADLVPSDAPPLGPGLITASADGSTTVILLDAQTRGSETGARPLSLSLYGNALVVEESFASARTFTLPEGNLPISDAMLSPDGRYLSIMRGVQTGSQLMPTATMVQILDMQSGEVVATSDAFAELVPQRYGWTYDSARFVAADGNAVSVWSPDAGSSFQEIASGSAPLVSLRFTRDPSVVVVNRMSDRFDQSERIDLDTGDVMPLGTNQSRTQFGRAPRVAAILVSDQPSGRLQVIDPVSSESLWTFDQDVGSSADDIWTTSSSDALVTLIYIPGSPPVVVRALDSQGPTVTALPVLPRDGEPTVMFTSNDGRYVATIPQPINATPGAPGTGTTGTAYILDVNADQPTWVPIGWPTPATPVAAGATRGRTMRG